MDIKYKYKYGTPIYIVANLPVFGLICTTMFVNEIKPKQVLGKDEFAIEYNLSGLFINIDVFEEVINNSDGVLQDDCKIWFFTNETKQKQFYLKEKGIV